MARRSRQRKRNDDPIATRLSRALDGPISILSPRRAMKRAQFRAAYDAIDGSRTRKKRSGAYLGGTGDSLLTQDSLGKLREIARDLSRNNPIAKGVLKTERDGVIGTGPKIQARTDDDKLSADIEAQFKEVMLESTCDVSSRFNFNKILRMMYLSYRRDGDAAVIFTKYGLQVIEGEQIGTPFNSNLPDPKHYVIQNGISFSKKTGRIVGYYVGKPTKWGYINPASVKLYPADTVHHMFNPERCSQSRGEPALTSAIDTIDKITEYFDAELIAAKVNACFTVFISRKEEFDPDDGYTGGSNSEGETDEGIRYEKVEPGTIMYGGEGESATGIGQVRPGGMFESFIKSAMMIIGRPLNMPLMLVTLDFAGATFMNARIAYQKCQATWEAEQTDVVVPFVSRTWRWFIDRQIAAGDLKPRDDIYRHEVMCNRWPYVDPFKESRADDQQLKNGTTNRTIIAARIGHDFEDVTKRRVKEEKLLADSDLQLNPKAPAPTPVKGPQK